MTSKQLINQLCYEYSTKNYNEEKLTATHEIKKNLNLLEEYKKIEEEIGIDFITLSKILKQRFVYDNDQVKIELLGLHIKSDELYLYGFVEDTMQAVYLRLKDYGITWTIKKEELENEKEI